MEEDEIKLEKIYKECKQELKSIGIKIDDEEKVGKIEIGLSGRSKKRYGVCKQEEPDVKTKYVEKKGKNLIVKYGKYKKHKIEISKWVMELNEDIIKNTVMHELIHCMPMCNNHGKEFKLYAEYINQKLGYNIKTTGNKKEDYEKSNKKYNEEKGYKYIIKCKNCGQIYYRVRKPNNLQKYRCGVCRGKLILIVTEQYKTN